MSKRSLDIQTQVLRELTSPSSFQWNVRESYAKIAKKLGLDEETVRLAVKRARESGFVERWRLFLNPNLVGEKSGAIQLELGNIAKTEAIAQVKLVCGVVLIFDFHGNALRIVFNFDTDRSSERKLKLFRSICHSKAEETLYWETVSPPCRLKVRTIDWQILKAISRNPRRNLQEVSKEVGASTRTVSRRLKAMIDGKMFYLIPVRNMKKSSGVLCNFMIRYQDEAQEEIENVINRVQKRIDFRYNLRGLYNVSMMLDNITEAEELNESISSLRGVADVKMNIIKDFIYVDDWLDEIIQKKLSSK